MEVLKNRSIRNYVRPYSVQANKLTVQNCVSALTGQTFGTCASIILDRNMQLLSGQRNKKLCQKWQEMYFISKNCKAPTVVVL